MEEIKIHDKVFIPLVLEKEIDSSIKKIAEEMYQVYKDETPIFIGILNGVVMFFSDLLKHYPGSCEIAFMQMSSYKGLGTSGNVKALKEISKDIKDRHIVILEDIVDTGNTLEKLYELIKEMPVKSVKIASLFFKPEAYKKDLKIDYIGLNIPNKFVVGYGLDYDELGRNYTDLYVIKEN